MPCPEGCPNVSAMPNPPAFRRYVALGDSLTEGLCDPTDPLDDRLSAHPWRGWADRLAEALSMHAVRSGGSDLEYANLAVRGKLLTEIVAEQVEPALGLAPDLVSLIGGGNDVLRPSVDLDELASRLDDAVRRLRAAGCTVLLSTAYDPRRMPLVRRTRNRSAVFTANVWTVAQRHGAQVLDLWGWESLYHPELWAPDRIHLTPAGHHRVAQRALELLGFPGSEDWRAPLPPRPPMARLDALRADASWFREFALPWIGRRLRGRSSGDGLQPKIPAPQPVGAAPGSLDRSLDRSLDGSSGGH